VSLANLSLVPAFGYAAGFSSASNSGVAVPFLGTSNQVTLEAWVKPRTLGVSNPYNAIYARDVWGSGTMHFQIYSLSSSAHYLSLSVYGNTPLEVFAPTTSAVQFFFTNQWVHLAATYD